MTGELDPSTCSEADLWRRIAVHLESNGIGVLLVGGAVVAIHTQGAFRSGDPDFVAEEIFEDRIEPCMEELGFPRRGRHYEHPDCPHLIVELVAGPLGIGDDLDVEPSRGLRKATSSSSSLPRTASATGSRATSTSRPANASTKQSSSPRRDQWTGAGSNAGAATKALRARRRGRT